MTYSKKKNIDFLFYYTKIEVNFLGFLKIQNEHVKLHVTLMNTSFLNRDEEINIKKTFDATNIMKVIILFIIYSTERKFFVVTYIGCLECIEESLMYSCSVDFESILKL